MLNLIKNCGNLKSVKIRVKTFITDRPKFGSTKSNGLFAYPKFFDNMQNNFIQFCIVFKYSIIAFTL